MYLWSVYMNQKVLLIINPCAGKMKSKSNLFNIVNCFCINNFDVTIYITSKKGDAINYVKEHAGNHDRIVCCGGDGTLNEVINGLMLSNAKIPVGYIPTGTTNDFAASINLPKNITRASKIAALGQPRNYDLGFFNKKMYFSYIASFGAFTKASYNTDQSAKNVWGHAAYIFEGMQNIGDIKPYHIKIKTSNIEEEGDFIFGSITNTTSLGGILKLNTLDVLMDDGKFEVMLIKQPKTPLDLTNTIQNLLSQIYNNENIIFIHTSKITIYTDEPIPWTVDGEFAGNEEKVILENIHNGIQVILPDKSNSTSDKKS